jgi:hypothetical protein
MVGECRAAPDQISPAYNHWHPLEATWFETAMTKRVAIVQSNYIPWKGYFDLINGVDEFILFDDMQYTKRDWRNRNLIKTPAGTRWLTIPVEVKGKFHQLVHETRVSDPEWARRHWSSIVQNYARAPYFRNLAPRIEGIYGAASKEPSLSRINRLFIDAICDVLGIGSRISWSMDYELLDSKTKRLVGLCRSAGATRYLSGPSARHYIEPRIFEEAGIALEYADYEGYPEYPQLWGAFEHRVTVLDLIFNAGPAAPRYMKSFG